MGRYFRYSPILCKYSKYIITAGTCATFGGLFREYKDDIEGFIIKKEFAQIVRFKNFSKNKINPSSFSRGLAPNSHLMK